VTATPVEVLLRAAQLGVKLGRRPSGKLTFDPANRCPPDFVAELQAFKETLLALLGLPFVMVFSEALGQMIFFCQDEATKEILIEAGADEWSIYTRDELQILVAQNRVAPLSQDDLKKFTLSNARSTRGLRNKAMPKQ
jgi:hypothetical protein